MDFEVKDFQKEVIEESYQSPVVVDFWAPWCGPCKILGPVIEKLAAQADGRWTLRKVNVDENQDVASQYGVRGIPAVKLFVDGRVEGEFTGALPEIQIERWLKEHIPSENDKVARKAVDLFEKGETQAARSLLQTVIDAEPNHSTAAFYLAKIKIFENPGEALDLFDIAAKDPKYLDDARFVRKLAELLHMRDNVGRLSENHVKPLFVEGLEALSRQDWDAAAGKFVEVVMKKKEYENEAAKDACVAIFNYLGNDHEVSRKYRRRFDMALY